MSFRVLTLAVACAAALPAFAQSGRPTDLDEVVVTANRGPVPVRDVIAPVEVIDREAIERSQARSLPDLLRGRAGISIGNQGGQGKLTTLFLRGAESDHVLVLVDGVRIGSATSGLASFQDLPLELIERIEIVRGPRSSLYGSEAIGGVIQVFTRRDAGAITPRVSFGGGSHESYEASAGVGGRAGRGWFGADYAWSETRGFNSCRGFGAPVFAGCFTTEPDRDGYQRESLSLRGGVDLGAGWSLRANALRAEGDNEYDGSFTNRSEIVQQVVGGELGWTPSESASLRLSAGRNVDTSDNFRNSTIFNGNFNTARDSAALQGDFVVAPGQRLSAGLDWLQDSVESTTRFTRTQRINRALFAQYLGDFGALDMQASARQDDNEQFGEYTTGNLSVGYELAPAWRASASVGNAFKAPTFNELYFPGSSNPDLGPERSRSIEAALAWTGTGAGLRLDVYRTEIDDLISYNSATRRPENIQAARLRGAELGGHADIAGWFASGSVSVVDAENRSTPSYGNRLPRRARQSARIELDRAFGDLRLGLTAAGEGPRYDDLANRRRLAGHGTLDLRAEYVITPDWRVQARLANVLDRGYETVEYYNQPGRTWFVTFRYAPTR